jgi:hypothetical protein
MDDTHLIGVLTAVVLLFIGLVGVLDAISAERLAHDEKWHRPYGRLSLERIE